MMNEDLVWCAGSFSRLRAFHNSRLHAIYCTRICRVISQFHACFLCAIAFANWILAPRKRERIQGCHPNEWGNNGKGILWSKRNEQRRWIHANGRPAGRTQAHTIKNINNIVLFLFRILDFRTIEFGSVLACAVCVCVWSGVWSIYIWKWHQHQKEMISKCAATKRALAIC